ncbi:heparanase-like isoform X2 [Stylophora pistillata]|uniref:Heparanase n=1 Tax=Stylophora pistillata TaxID=50429 RepID=A0A2B4SC67_STYPI|nr:heparanase-like isoform X2 [Stylophora pistillata]PFX26400.1 Heparanase [Stylophora pistillata]
MASPVHSASSSLVVITVLILLSAYLPSGKSQFFVFGRGAAVKQNVSVNLDRSVFTVNKKFLSVAIDSGIMMHHWPYVNFTSEKLYTLAKGLSPAFLRIGGTAEDFLIYDNSKDMYKLKNMSNFTITHEDLDKIHLLSSKATWDVLFGLNVLLRGKDGSWNASNPKEIMQYVADHGYHFGWELGNEPDLLWKFGRSISSEELAEDFCILRAILEGSPQFGNFLVGPDMATITSEKTESFLKSFFTHAEDTIDAVTWHQYYVDGRTCSEKDFYDPEVLDRFLHELSVANSILDGVEAGFSRWLGETSSAYGGGASGLSDRYVAGFMWLDKLGLAARLKHEVVVRQTFFGGNYALLDKNLDPNPDFWLSLLHKRLVGVKVLDVSGQTEEKRKVRVYAHCSSSQYPMGSVTLFALNVHLDEPVVLKLNGELKGKDVDVYLLTPENGDLLTKTVRLNGKVLNLVDDRTLPDLVPKSVPGDEPLDLPPLTFGFYVIPEASASACG